MDRFLPIYGLDRKKGTYLIRRALDEAIIVFVPGGEELGHIGGVDVFVLSELVSMGKKDKERKDGNSTE